MPVYNRMLGESSVQADIDAGIELNGPRDHPGDGEIGCIQTASTVMGELLFVGRSLVKPRRSAAGVASWPTL